MAETQTVFFLAGSGNSKLDTAPTGDAAANAFFAYQAEEEGEESRRAVTITPFRPETRDKGGIGACEETGGRRGEAERERRRRTRRRRGGREQGNGREEEGGREGQYRGG